MENGVFISILFAFKLSVPTNANKLIEAILAIGEKVSL